MRYDTMYKNIHFFNNSQSKQNLIMELKEIFLRSSLYNKKKKTKTNLFIFSFIRFIPGFQNHL